MPPTDALPSQTGSTLELPETFENPIEKKYPELVKFNDDGSVDVNLVEALEAKGLGTIDRLHLRPIRVKHLRKMDPVKGEVARQCVLIQELAGLPASVLDEMGGPDFIMVGEVAAALLGKFPGTGETS